MEQQQSFRDRQRENRDPLPYALFKGVTGKFGALRLTLKKAYDPRNTRKKDDGCVFLEAAPPIDGGTHYDWENSKISIALSITDIPKIILYLRQPSRAKDGKLSIYHDTGAGTDKKGQTVKTLNFWKSPDRDNIFVTVGAKIPGQQLEAKVTVSPDEAVAMGTLLQTAIPLILAWD
jgi:hypothetical protein